MHLCRLIATASALAFLAVLSLVVLCPCLVAVAGTTNCRLKKNRAGKDTRF
jgi:hypothetical protein